MFSSLAFVLCLSSAVDVVEQPLPRMLVLDLDAANMPEQEARAIDAIVVANARVDGLVLVTQQELRKLAELDAAAQSAGCDTSSCLAEIAGALGARYVLFGSTSRLGDSVTVSLSVFDVDAAQTTREAVTVSSLAAVNTTLPSRVKALVRTARGLSAPGPSPLFVAGVATTALGTLGVIGGGGYAAWAEFGVINNENADGAAKREAQDNGKIALAVGGIGVVVGVVGSVMLVAGSGE